MRTFQLYLRSRPLVEAAAGLAAIALLTALLLNGFPDRYVVAATPIAAVIVVIGSLRSPFGEAEQAVGTRLPPMRVGLAVGMLGCAALALALAARSGGEQAVTRVDVAWMLPRNLIGYAGLAFIGARIAGPGAAWVLPVAAGAAAVVELVAGGTTAWWAWPASPRDDTAVALVAAGLMLAGLALTAREARPRLFQPLA